MREPYIGITGFMSSREVSYVLDTRPVTNRLIMIGVLASLKTMQGIQNKWPNRYPRIDNVADIFVDHPQALNLIHYNTKELDTLTDQLIEMTEIGGSNLHGFQLNIAWPSPSTLIAYRKMFPEKQIVLQIGGRAFEVINRSPKQLAGRVADYEGIVDYVLLDPSGGYGEPFCPRCIHNYLLELKIRKLDMGLGVAGGLSPTTLSRIRLLVREFPDLNIDAEGRLRTQDDCLDLNLAGEYLRKACGMFG